MVVVCIVRYLNVPVLYYSTVDYLYMYDRLEMRFIFVSHFRRSFRLVHVNRYRGQKADEAEGSPRHRDHPGTGAHS